jgi:LuxR family maltose regulon positive regulatory protein
MHLVLLTRADPALPLARLRARGQLIEIRAEHLRFSVDEAAQFLNRIMGLSLTGEQVAALEARTEGWITGLQLAALSMQGHDDVQRFVSAFTGSHRYIVDFLAEEVLNRQSKHLSDFLVKTSILERFCAPLCDAVMGGTSSESVLQGLERANLFLIPLDTERH